MEYVAEKVKPIEGTYDYFFEQVMDTGKARQAALDEIEETRRCNIARGQSPTSSDFYIPLSGNVELLTWYHADKIARITAALSRVNS